MLLLNIVLLSFAARLGSDEQRGVPAPPLIPARPRGATIDVEEEFNKASSAGPPAAASVSLNLTYFFHLCGAQPRSHSPSRLHTFHPLLSPLVVKPSGGLGAWRGVAWRGGPTGLGFITCLAQSGPAHRAAPATSDLPLFFFPLRSVSACNKCTVKCFWQMRFFDALLSLWGVASKLTQPCLWRAGHRACCRCYCRRAGRGGARCSSLPVVMKNSQARGPIAGTSHNEIQSPRGKGGKNARTLHRASAATPRHAPPRASSGFEYY